MTDEQVERAREMLRGDRLADRSEPEAPPQEAERDAREDREWWTHERRPWPMRMEFSVFVEEPRRTRTFMLDAREVGSLDELLAAIDELRAGCEARFRDREA